MSPLPSPQVKTRAGDGVGISSTQDWVPTQNTNTVATPPPGEWGEGAGGVEGGTRVELHTREVATTTPSSSDEETFFLIGLALVILPCAISMAPAGSIHSRTLGAGTGSMQATGNLIVVSHTGGIQVTRLEAVVGAVLLSVPGIGAPLQALLGELSGDVVVDEAVGEVTNFSG